MNHLSLRGDTYQFDHAVAGRRVRCSLGTHETKVAERLVKRISLAIADGPKSPLWADLKPSLPKSSYRILTTTIGVQLPPDLHEFEKRYLLHLGRRVQTGNLSERSRALYESAARRFFLEMARYFVRKMDAITPGIIDDYYVWRKEDILAKGGSGRSLIFESSVLSSIFTYAVEEGVIETSPLKRRPKPDAEPRGAEPFSPAELKLMDLSYKTPQERLIYGLFRWTGLRCSDVADLRWSAINWHDRTLTWRTRKRGKLVTIPIVDPLLKLLRTARIEGADTILGGPDTQKLYKVIREIGKRNFIENASPHRFRDTMAVTMLGRGATIYDVAKMLGDTVETIEKHYAPFTKELQERVRGILEAS